MPFSGCSALHGRNPKIKQNRMGECGGMESKTL